MNKYGKTSRCVTYDSKLHWAAKCPHRQDKSNNLSESHDDESIEEINLVLLTEDKDSNVFVSETCQSGIADTACTKTVCDKVVKNFLNRLGPKSTKGKTYSSIITRGGHTPLFRSVSYTLFSNWDRERTPILGLSYRRSFFLHKQHYKSTKLKKVS